MVFSSVLLGVLFPRFYGDICFVAGIVFATVAFLVFLVSVVSIGFLPLRVFGVVVSALDSLPAGFCLAWLRTPKRPRGISWHFGPGLGAVKNLYIIYIYHTVLNKEMDPLVQFAGATTQAKRKEMLDFLSLLLFRPPCPFISVSLSFDCVSFSIWVLISLAFNRKSCEFEVELFPWVHHCCLGIELFKLLILCRLQCRTGCNIRV